MNTKYQNHYLRKILANIARDNPKTKEVVLNGFTVDNDHMAQLTMSLVSNTHIEILCLNDCGITSKGAHLLAYALGKNRSLDHVWLNDNKIGSSGAEAIASSLTKNQTLLTVGLSNNSIGNHGGKALAKAMRQNHSITDVFVEGNRMSDRIEDEINRICDGEVNDGGGDDTHEYQFCHDGSNEKSKQEDNPACKNNQDEDMIDDETAAMSNAELLQRIQLVVDEIRIFRSDVQCIQHESRGERERIRENTKKGKLNKQLPYLVGNAVEVLEPEAEDGLEETVTGSVVTKSYENRTLDSIKEVDCESDSETEVDSWTSSSLSDDEPMDLDHTCFYQKKKERKLSKLKAITRMMKRKKIKPGLH
eukprot:CAMPEP_0201956384 /NCGR_PEP_ID=MMETSP0904-20121228/3817_1 /ASSEMBLY_ACC=CAM_ASM_000553 /TAXON_ID=420261 /ORGANISM="Thalassiosira antarctica, Strain CCMP982" /LENGTH=361 /DNA_ID=CAMNT_0048500887 /DNA_START=44 /DNA_END=1129 /DNA_ORIENTATION=-